MKHSRSALVGFVSTVGILIASVALAAGNCQSTDSTGKSVQGTCAVTCGAGQVQAGQCADQTTPLCCIAAPASSAGSSMVLTDPLGGIGLIGIISRLVLTFLGVVGALALLVFVYAGVTYMTAGGDDSKVTKAKDAMKYAFIGLALIMGAYVLTNFYFTVLTQNPPAPAAATPPTP